MKIEKKYIVAAGLGVVSVAAALAYLQYKKLMNYCIGFNNIKINDLTKTKADFNVFLNLQNKSDLKIEIVSQEYSVYLNDSFITKISNPNTQLVAPNSTSVVSVNVKFNPTKVANILSKNAIDLLLSWATVKLRVDIKLKVKLWFFTINIPYVYKTTLKELMAPSKTPVAQDNKCK